MFFKTLCVLILAPLLEGNISLAQDPLKVESTHYKLAFENERVQVVSIHYGPHEKSNMHSHPPGVVVNLTNGHLRFTDQKGVVQEVRALRGEARWFPGLTHKVENLSDLSYDAVYVGVKGTGGVISSNGEPPVPDALVKQGLTKEGSPEDRLIERALLTFLLANNTSPGNPLSMKPASHQKPALRSTGQQ